MKIKIIYETQNGTTQYVTEIMQQELQKHGHEVDLHSVRAKGQNVDLAGYDVVLFGAPTYDDGKLETAMKVFITRFNDDLSKYKVAVFGLGNRTYPQFCTAATILEDWVKQKGGVPMVETLKIDGFPDNLQPIESWIAQIVEKLK